MWKIDVSSKLGPDYVAAAEDVLRAVVVQVFVHALLVSIDSDASFFDPAFWLVLAYVALGLAAYHLVFKRIVAVV
jgi:hypothetical protein